MHNAPRGTTFPKGLHWSAARIAPFSSSVLMEEKQVLKMKLFGNVMEALKFPNKPADYLRLNMMVIRSMGILHSDDCSLSNLHAIMVYLVLLIHGISGSFDLYWNTSVSTVTLNLPITTLALGASHRLYFYTKNRKKYQEVIKAVADHFIPSSPLEEVKMTKWLQLSRIIMLMYVGYGGLLACTWQFQPIIKYALMVSTQRYSHNGTEQPISWDMMEFPSRVIYPFEAKQAGIYQAVFIFQGIAIFFAGSMILVTDMMFITLCLLLCGQFEILKDMLRNMTEIAILKIQTQYRHLKTNYIVQLVNREQIEEDVLNKEINKILGRCAQHHNLLLRLIKELDELHWPIYVINFSCLLIIFSFNAFDLSSPNHEAGYYVRAVYQMAYLITAIIQMFLLCQCGDKLLEQEESVANAAYESKWYDCSESVKKTIRIIVLRTKKIERITIGRVAPLNMNIFSDMLSRSFSYFTVLRQMRDES